MTLTAAIPADLETKVKEYRRLRPIMTSLHSELIRLIRKEDSYACAKRLQMYAKQDGKKVILFEHEFEMDIFQDYLIYMNRPHGINAVQQMLNMNRYPKNSDEYRLLEGMAMARFSVYTVKQIVNKAGFIGIDYQTGDEFFIMDLTLPEMDVVGYQLGFRIFPFDGYWMHTGANLTLGRIADLNGFKPGGKIESYKEERDFNEAMILYCRSIFSETEE